MQNGLKPFGERGIGLLSPLFSRARFALTAVYVLILAVILLISGGLSRSIFSGRLQQRFAIEGEQVEVVVQRRLPPTPNYRMIQSDFQDTIVLVNGILLLLAGLLSYGLAGITLRPIQEAYDKQKQFVSDASHELRTPLAILKVELENQRTQKHSTDVYAVIDSHLEEVDRMTRLVDDLLRLSKMQEMDTESLKQEEVALAPLLAKAVSRLLPLAREKSIQLAFDEGADTSLVVLGDEAGLMQVFTNIIKNAIAYNANEGSVTVRLVQEKQSCVVEVCDTGLGMNKREVAHVFDRFYRTEKSRSRKTGGSGLGMAIARGTILAHGGRIEVQSKPQIGTTVRVSLPIHRTS